MKYVLSPAPRVSVDLGSDAPRVCMPRMRKRMAMSSETQARATFCDLVE